MKSRAQRIAKNMDGMDAVVIMNGGEPYLDSSFWYVTEQTSGLFESSFAIISESGELDVVVNPLEATTAESGKGTVHVYDSRESRDKILRKVLKGKKKVGINSVNAPYAYARYIQRMGKNIKLVDASMAINAAMSVKDDNELKNIRKACDITSRVARELPDILKPGMTEREVASEMDIRMKRYGATGMAFDTIACFGANAADPHHMPTDRKIKKGDVALFDFGCKYNRYCSDLTRTIFFGKPSAKAKRAYEIVLNAQTAGIEAIRHKAKACEPDLAARKVIDDSEFNGTFIHSFGHGIGMDVHQPIHVSHLSKQKLRAGNIISAEPGVYVPGEFGIRIEDTMLVTKEGSERLTSYDHSLMVI